MLVLQMAGWERMTVGTETREHLHKPVNQEIISDLIDWMVDGAPPSANAREIIEGICGRLIEAGVPVARFVLFIYTLHPNISGRRFAWTPEDGLDLAEAKMGLFSTEEYTNNPLPHVIDNQTAVRRKLHDPDCPDDYKILGELRERGLTDYFLQPLVFTTGETHAVSWSSKAANGFSNDAIAALERVFRPLARLTEIYMLRLNAANLLSAYVGRGSGDQILQGKVHRGDGEEILAVILFVDIANFTMMSNTMAGPDIVAMLNDVFDALVPPVEAAGGEVLKFLGDGFFAIFPIADDDGIAVAAEAAMDAVDQGEAALAAQPQGETVAFRSAIHCGRFHFGNIGGADRLDFTAIGRSVNYTARLLVSASELGQSRVLSQKVAEACQKKAKIAGEARFKGFEGSQRVYSF